MAVAPAVPALVVIKITPFLPCEPYKVAAAKPLSTLTEAILLGSKSKKREEPLLPSTKLLPTLASPLSSLLKVLLLKGTPSTINKGWLLWLKEL